MSDAGPAGGSADQGPKRVRFNPVVEEHDADPDGDHEMAVSMVERLYQDDMKWTVNSVDDMCAKDEPDMSRMVNDFAYFDEITWEPLNSKDVQKGEREEYERFCKMGVYEYMDRKLAQQDQEGKFVKVKWVRTKKGSGVRCRLVAQELGYGERLDELFAGTPSLGAVRIALTHAARDEGHKIMVMDVKCAFLYGDMRRNVYIELPHTDPRYGDENVVGKLKKSMYGTRDAPQIWAEHVRATLEGLGYRQSVYQPSVYFHPGKSVFIVVHVDDFLCTGKGEELEELYRDLTAKYELKKIVLGLNDERETKYLNRILRVTDEGIEVVGDPKHSELLFKDWGVTEHSRDVNTPSLKDLEANVATGEELSTDLATKVRRGIARINYMAQDRPDLSSAAKVMSQHMAKPHEGVVPLLKRCVKYLKRFPTAGLLVPRGLPADDHELVAWTDSDWAGDANSRRSTSGGVIVYRGATIMHWSKAQSNVALSSAEAELNACVKGLSELLGLSNLISEALRVTPSLRLCTDASACRGMLLRHGVGKVKHLSVKQLWSQEAVQSFGVQIDRVARVDNPADLLTHSVSFPVAETQLARLRVYRDGIGGRELALAPS